MKYLIPRTNGDEYCRRIKPDTKPLYIHDSLVKGLVFRVMPTGSKSWILRYHYKEGNEWKQRKTGLGAFRQGRNDVTGYTVDAARTEAQRIKSKVKHEGDDPIESRRKIAIQRLVEKNERVTVNDLFERWASVDLIKRKDGGIEACRMMKKDVLPSLGLFNIKEVQKVHISEITDRLLQRGVNRMAKVVFSLIRQMFRFAIIRGLLEIDPTAFIPKKSIGGANVERDRVLNDDEIQHLSQKLSAANMVDTTVLAVWIVLGTCCRIGELLKARWNHFDLQRGTWRIPSENSKNGREHIVSLSPFVLDHLNRLHAITGIGEWCFPASRKDGHVDPKTITKQLVDRQRVSGSHSNRTKNIGALALPRGIWKPHDLRRTGATLMTALGVLPEVADRCLNHTEENRMKRTYQRYTYEKEMKQAWEKLGEHLNFLIGKSNGKDI